MQYVTKWGETPEIHPPSSSQYSSGMHSGFSLYKRRLVTSVAGLALLAGASQSVMASHNKPNLAPYIPEGASAPFTIEQSPNGGKWVLNFAIVNDSKYRVKDDFSVRFYVDGKKIYSLRTTPLGAHKYRKRGPYELSSSKLKKGDTVTMKVDALSEISESSETDNEAKVKVAGGGSSGDDSSFSLPLAGGYDWTVTANAGDPNDDAHRLPGNYFSLDFVPGNYTNRPVPIFSMHAGKVIEVISARDYVKYGGKYAGLPANGFFVRVDMDGDGNAKTGIVTVYCHFSKPPQRANGEFLRKGDRIERGDMLGHMGTTGWSTGDHLHITIKCDGGSDTAAQRQCVRKLKIEGLGIEDFKNNYNYPSTMTPTGR